MDKNDFKEKLIVFNLLKNEQDNEKKIYDFLKKIKIKYNNLYEKFIKCEYFMKTFFDNQEQNYIKEIKNHKEILKHDTIGVSLNRLEGFLNDSKKYHLYEKYFQLIDSKFFMALYSHNKKQNDTVNQKSLFEKSIKDFIKLSILNNYDEEYNINKIPFKDIILDGIIKIIEKSKLNKNNIEQKCLQTIKNELNFINELNIINNKQLKNNNNNKDIIKNSFNDFTRERNIILLPYFEKAKKVILSLIILIDLFKVNKTDFYDKITDKYNEIENNNNNICLKDIKNYIDFLKK